MTRAPGFGDQTPPLDPSFNFNIRELSKTASSQISSVIRHTQIFQNHIPKNTDPIPGLAASRLTPFVRNPLTLRELLNSGMLNELELTASLKNAPLKEEVLTFFEGVMDPNAVLKFTGATRSESKVAQSCVPTNLPLEKFVEIFREIKRNPQNFTLEAGGKIYGHEKSVRNTEMEKYATENDLTIVALTEEELEDITQAFENIFLPILDSAVIKYNETQRLVQQDTNDDENEIKLELQPIQSITKNTSKDRSKDKDDIAKTAHLLEPTLKPKINTEKEEIRRDAQNKKEYRYQMLCEYIRYLILQKELLDTEDKDLINRDMSGRSLRRKIE